jgi:protocatechuate 3,4-dioxygenase beta subunit
MATRKRDEWMRLFVATFVKASALGLVALVAIAVNAHPSRAADANRPAVAGVVSDLSGKPVAGATVIVWTAGVKKGYSTYCPSCYADCGKRAVTDSGGAFAFTRLDPEN